MPPRQHGLNALAREFLTARPTTCELVRSKLRNALPRMRPRLTGTAANIPAVTIAELAHGLLEDKSTSKTGMAARGRIGPGPRETLTGSIRRDGVGYEPPPRTSGGGSCKAHHETRDCRSFLVASIRRPLEL